MPHINFSQNYSQLDILVRDKLLRIQDCGVATYDWLQPEDLALSNREQAYLNDIQTRLLSERLQLINEMTTWVWAIYPMLILAEQDAVRAWAGMPLAAKYPKFSLDGTVGCVLGQATAGEVKVAHFLVANDQRRLEAKNLQAQLYGQMLAAARLNREANQRSPQEIFGCYTISDSWTLARGEVDSFEDEQVSLRVEFSREFSERLEAATILKILKGIIARRLAQTELASTG